MSDGVDHLARIVVRKRLEVARRVRRAAVYGAWADAQPAPAPGFVDLLRRERLGSVGGAPTPRAAPRVIAEIKLKSPSAGEIRARKPGELTRIARAYETAGAAAVSVLCDGPGFGGGPLDLRRVASVVSAPVLFKEFVVHRLQVDMARALGASFVLLLARVLDDAELRTLIQVVRSRGLEPVVEAADGEELDRALRTEATVIGINARDLRSFSVDAGQARALVDRIPEERIAVFMSGVRSADDFARVAQSRADAVLIGEGLMRAQDPGAALKSLLAASPR
jgi:indole-3-glycerol phosphate synthase